MEQNSVPRKQMTFWRSLIRIYFGHITNSHSIFTKNTFSIGSWPMRYHRVIVCFLFIRMTTQHRIKVHPKIESIFPMLIDRNAKRDANVSNAIECMPVCRKLCGKKRKNVRMEWKINADVVKRSPADPKITIKCFVQTSLTHAFLAFEDSEGERTFGSDVDTMATWIQLQTVPMNSCRRGECVSFVRQPDSIQSSLWRRYSNECSIKVWCSRIVVYRNV